MSRRVTFLVLFSLVVTACGTRASPQGHPPPLHSIRWIIAGAAGITTLDPAQVADPNTAAVCGLLYDGLVRLNRKLQIVPAAARSWRESHHGFRYVFQLRQGLRFSNGTSLTNSDVVRSFRRAIELAFASGTEPDLSEVALVNGQPAIYRAGHLGVEFLLSQPSPEFLAKLTFVGSDIVDMGTVARYGAVWTDHADGLGPYRVDGATAGSRLTVVRNPFFRPIPRLRRIAISFAPHASSAVSAFVTGRADIVTGLQQLPANTKALSRDIHTAPQLALNYVLINTRVTPLTNWRLRRALGLAVDRGTLARAVFGRLAVANGSVVPPALLPSAAHQTFAPLAAAQQLTTAGYPFGGTVKPLELIYPRSPIERREAAILRSQWRSVLNVRVQPRPLSLTAYRIAISTGNFQLALAEWGARYPDPADFLDYQLSGGSPGNLAGWNYPPFDALVRSSRKQGIDSPNRRLLLFRAAAVAAQRAPWIPLSTPVQITLTRPGARTVSLAYDDRSA
jgi:peptide/nickel transport system substrate-binding protein/oligopeptide transport system substrate-binding protein